MKKQITDSEKKQRERYQINIKLDSVKDAKVIEQLRCCKNKQGYIKKLILNDLYELGPFV